MSRGVAISLLLMVSSPAVAEDPKASDEPAFDVFRYALSLRPDIKTGAVSGTETVWFKATKDLRQIEFSPNSVTIDGATIDGEPSQVSTDAKGVVFTLPAMLKAGRTSVLRVAFRGIPKRGLVTRPGAIYASYFACDWMLCRQDSPGDKAWFDLDLYLPEGAISVGIGRQPSTRPVADGLTVHRWRSPRPYSSYLFGFAAGKLRLAEQQHAGTRFTYVDAGGDQADLDRLFADTPAISDFLAAKAGLPVPDKHYTQILAFADEAQELATYSLIGAEALQADLRNPSRQWIIAHEMAHQWWGNLVTCATWQDFWLNEGFATFMTAAWKQHRFGEAAYQAELDEARRRVKRVTELGYDEPLAWNGTYPSLGYRRAIQYSKGALFLASLRTELGERAFWKGVQEYTRRFAGKTVRSSDFERVMAEASGRDLSAIFAKWVYGAPAGAER